MELLTSRQLPALITAAVLAMLANLIGLLSSSLALRSYRESQAASLSHHQRRISMILVISQSIIAIAIQGVFGVLFWQGGGAWSLYLLNSIILSSMAREVRK